MSAGRGLKRISENESVGMLRRAEFEADRKLPGFRRACINYFRHRSVFRRVRPCVGSLIVLTSTTNFAHRRRHRAAGLG